MTKQKEINEFKKRDPDFVGFKRVAKWVHTDGSETVKESNKIKYEPFVRVEKK